MQWGILGPGQAVSNRRIRTLDLAVATRDFNERAVPGLGGVWFGRQIYLATLGVCVARAASREGSTASPIAVANAIEALACWLTLKQEVPHREIEGLGNRVRGQQKLAEKTAEDMVFDTIRSTNFYVSQPMRMASVNALPALGLVETTGSRFNSFFCTEAGEAFVNAMVDGARPYRCDAVTCLVDWVLGKKQKLNNTRDLQIVLNLQQRMPDDAARMLEAALTYNATGSAEDEDARRRRDALAWVRTRHSGAAKVSWENQPAEIRNSNHWEDLKAGAAFFLMRDAAIAVLDALETEINTLQGRFVLGTALPAHVNSAITLLRNQAQLFLKQRQSLSRPADSKATRFAEDMIDEDAQALLRALVLRDDRILRLDEDVVRPGPAFQGGGTPPPSDPDHESAGQSDNPLTADSDPGLPEGISGRMHNLWLLAKDIDDTAAAIEVV